MVMGAVLPLPQETCPALINKGSSSPDLPALEPTVQGEWLVLSSEICQFTPPPGPFCLGTGVRAAQRPALTNN